MPWPDSVSNCCHMMTQQLSITACLHLVSNYILVAVHAQGLDLLDHPVVLLDAIRDLGRLLDLLADWCEC